MSTKNSLTPTNEYKKILSAVHLVYRLVNSTYSVKELALRLTRLLCQFIQADSASVFILDESREGLAMIAIFDNRINILLDKRKDLSQVKKREFLVTQGTSIFESHLIGLPLIADDNIGAIFIRRDKRQKPFTDFDREMLNVFSEQSVTAIHNLQLYEQQQNVIVETMKLIDVLLSKQGHDSLTHAPVYFKVVNALAQRLNLGPQAIRNLYYASVLHNAGCVEIPFNILSKKSALSAEEFRLIKDHPKRSVELIKPIHFLKPVLPIILYHHEKYDGSGYPSRLKKEQIPMGARILAVVDAFEAMVRKRPYRRKLTVNQAIQEIKANSGTQFDPKIVQAFCELSQQKKFRKLLSSF